MTSTNWKVQVSQQIEQKNAILLCQSKHFRVNKNYCIEDWEENIELVYHVENKAVVFNSTEIFMSLRKHQYQNSLKTHNEEGTKKKIKKYKFKANLQPW